MKLETVTAELRPRSDWESIDLGLALVRRDFWGLSGAWWLGMSPVLLIVLPLLWGHPFWFAFVFWWWIPVASRLTLFKLSRILFGGDPGWKELVKELPQSMKRRFFFRMVVARFSPWRPLTMPVGELEGLRGKEYSARCRILMRRGDSSVIMLAMWRIFLSFWLAVTLFFTGMLFVPESSAAVWQDTMSLWGEGDFTSPTGGMSALLLLSYCGALWVVDLFSVGCGFGIYVNHRTWIEGWDVELSFRRIGNRLREMAGALVGAVLLFAFSGTVNATQDPEVDQAIQTILQDEDFEVHKETSKEWKGWDWDWGSGGGGGTFLEALGVLLKVLFFGGLAALLVWLIYRYRHVFVGRGGVRAPQNRAQARVVMGMEVTPESLPDSVPTAALAAWRAGRRQEAMSLLYRGSIAWMIRHGGVEIAESDTESDCLGRVARAGASHVDYFQDLTGDWVRLAYAREHPSDDRVEQLCGRWPFGEGGKA